MAGTLSTSPKNGCLPDIAGFPCVSNSNLCIGFSNPQDIDLTYLFPNDL